MLAADKLQLQSALKQQATALKEKEFNLHHSNLMTVGTQAAVLAGLDITMFIEFNPPHNDDWGQDMKLFPRILKFAYYCVIVSAFCANMIVVSHTTALSVLGAGMALRGPDGSMMTATDGLYEERKTVFFIFGIGLACTVGSVVIIVWIILQWESAVCCMLIALMTCRTIWMNYRRVSQRFDFDESETVDFRDIMEGPAAIQAMPMTQKKGSASALLYRGAATGVGVSVGNNRNDDYSSYWKKKSSSLPIDTTTTTTMGEDVRDVYATVPYDIDYEQGNNHSNNHSNSTSRRLLERNTDQTRQRRGRSSSPKDHFIQTV